MSIVFAILLFSILIFVHELGHFLAAKASNVQVNEFSMFMGPAIFKKKVGETLYSIRCIPIGGYCAMEGEDADTDSPRSFQKAPWWKRLIILVAGSGMNLVAGFLIMLIVFAPAVQFVTPVISAFDEGCALVGDNGLQVGDRFLEVDGEKIYTHSDFSMILSLNGGDVHDLVVERDGEKVYLNDFKMEKRLFGNEETPRYGFSFSVEDATFGAKLRYSVNSCINVVRTVRLSLQMLLTGKAGFSDMSGPVGIVQQMSNVADQSATWVDALMNMLYFGGFIAINLAVMNLLPIPALDGGRVVALLLTTVIEKITRKKINPKYEGYIHGAGMILLLILMAVIMFKDIFYIFKG
ncbi:MAG: site-2 protease family protein [Oscillospiraceae bacterium]|nr:site-2 protease family protein [Oscillospiraceae bacterium]